MRCAVLFSIFSLALLSFVGWVRQDSQRSAMLDLDEAASDDEIVLFIG